MAEVYIPADYAIDALSMEAERRRKARGLIRYSYGDLVADTTAEEREQIAEDYRQKLMKAKKKGRHRVSYGAGLPLETDKVPEEMHKRMKDAMEEAKAGQ